MKHLLTLCLGLLGSATLAKDVCHDISAKAGWQAARFPAGQVETLFASGFWTIEDGVLGLAGTQGHMGEAAKDLYGAGVARIDPNSGYGALLVRFEIGDSVQQMPWKRLMAFTEQSGVFNMNLDVMEFRINEPDAALADNAGAIAVCMRYVDEG